LAKPEGSWIDHLSFARAASAWKIQHLGNEAGLPSQANVAEMIALYGPK
jgi:sugar/nucleoside kinase (ribokinase family)